MLPNKVYNFRTLAAAILGASYANMKVISVMGYTEAVKHADVTTQYQAVSGVLTGLLPANSLTYNLLEDPSGNRVVMATEYIDPASLTLVTTTNLRVDIMGVTTVTEATLRARLLELGINNFTITVI